MPLIKYFSSHHFNKSGNQLQIKFVCSENLLKEKMLMNLQVVKDYQ